MCVCDALTISCRERVLPDASYRRQIATSITLIRICWRTTAASWRATTTIPSTLTTTEVVSRASARCPAAATLISTRTPSIDQDPSRPAAFRPCRKTTHDLVDWRQNCWPWRRNRSSETTATGSTRTTACRAATPPALVASTRTTLTRAPTCVRWSRTPRTQVVVTSPPSNVTSPANHALS